MTYYAEESQGMMIAYGVEKKI